MDKQKFSYALGVNLGANFEQQGFLEEVDANEMAKAIVDYVAKNTSVSLEESAGVVNEYLGELGKKQHSKNIEIGQAFLAENAKKEGVTQLASGLQYEVINAGSGKKPGATSQVKTHYHGTLLDGTVFDSSVARNQPASFGVNQVIKGWTEALQLMEEGAKWKLYVPHDLAYGEQGAGRDITPYSTLIFEVELLEVL